jgi:hypothetical protein
VALMVASWLALASSVVHLWVGLAAGPLRHTATHERRASWKLIYFDCDWVTHFTVSCLLIYVA